MPECYDIDFVEFAATFDELVEPLVKATYRESIAGRALFYPNYDSSLIVQEHILPGHAWPAKMVETFVSQYMDKKDIRSDLERITNANDAVHWTLHTMINLLRQSQLTATKDVEGTNPHKGLNSIYTKNVFRILRSKLLDQI